MHQIPYYATNGMTEMVTKGMAKGGFTNLSVFLNWIQDL
jgi:hypothetical protein